MKKYKSKPIINMLNKFDCGDEYIIIRDDETLGKRECTVRIDDPGLDCTDGAHPAWWRGSHHTATVYKKRIKEILDILPKSNHLKLLADWFDMKQNDWDSNNTDIQDDLREWANNIKNINKRYK